MQNEPLPETDLANQICSIQNAALLHAQSLYKLTSPIEEQTTEIKSMIDFTMEHVDKMTKTLNHDNLMRSRALTGNMLEKKFKELGKEKLATVDEGNLRKLRNQYE